MKNQPAAGERGLIKMILIIIAALLIISYFGINLRDLVNAPTTQDNITYVATTTVTVWDSYLKVPATYLWQNIFLDLIWNPSMHNLIEARNGQTLDIASSTPIVPFIPIPKS